MKLNHSSGIKKIVRTAFKFNYNFCIYLILGQLNLMKSLLYFIFITENVTHVHEFKDYNKLPHIFTSCFNSYQLSLVSSTHTPAFFSISPLPPRLILKTIIRHHIMSSVNMHISIHIFKQGFFLNITMS